MEAILERLVAANIELLPALELTTHFVFTRDGFVALVERRPNGFGHIGSPGILTERGVALLVWRGAQAFFVAKGFERPASAEEIETLRAFATALKNCLTA